MWILDFHTSKPHFGMLTPGMCFEPLYNNHFATLYSIIIQFADDTAVGLVADNKEKAYPTLACVTTTYS